MMRLKYIIIIITALTIPAQSLFSETERDPVIQYYLDNIDDKLGENILFVDYVTVSAGADLVYNKINYRGKVDDVDTAAYVVSMKDGVINIEKTIDSAGVEQNVLPDTIRFVKPWELDCYFYFFPNDTGSGELAIGFGPNHPDSGVAPAGLMLIDRETYELKKLFVHFRHRGNFERYSIEYHFHSRDFGVAPELIIFQGTFAGYFQHQYFRQDLYLKDYHFE